MKAGPTGNLHTAASTGVSSRNSFVINGGRIAASGDITSLLNGNAPVLDLTGRAYTFIGLFYDCASLVAAPNLPCTTVSNYSFTRMFENCTSLTSVA